MLQGQGRGQGQGLALGKDKGLAFCFLSALRGKKEDTKCSHYSQTSKMPYTGMGWDRRNRLYFILTGLRTWTLNLLVVQWHLEKHTNPTECSRFQTPDIWKILLSDQSRGYEHKNGFLLWALSTLPSLEHSGYLLVVLLDLKALGGNVVI